MAAGKAMQSVGQDLTGSAQTVQDAASRYQAEQDQGAEFRARLAMQKAAADHQLFREQNPDESTWEADITQRLGSVRESVGKEKVSSSGRERLDMMLSGWEGEYKTGTARDALHNQRARNRTDMTRLAESYQRSGDFESARKIYDQAESTGLFQKGELDADRNDLTWRETKWKEDQADKAQQNEIAADPAAWWEAHKDKAPDGMDAMKYQRMRDYARQRLAERSFEDTDTIEDAIVSGKITKPEEIDHLGADLRPSVREKLKEGLIRRQSETFKAEASTPEYQNRVVGEVGGMLRDWNPEDQGFDERYVEMAQRVRTLPPGAVREELERQMDAVRAGRKAEVKTHADAAFQALDDYAKAGGFGKEPEVSKIPLKKMIDDGFLRDQAKLRRLGFSESQAKDIAGAKDSGAAQKLFTDNWGKRESGSVNASPDEISVADAIRLGHGETGFDDPEALARKNAAIMQRDQAYGAAKTKLAEWIKRNPKATQTEINSYVRDLSDEPTSKRLSSGIYERKASVSFNDLPATAPRGNFQTSENHVITEDTQAQVMRNASGYLKDPGYDLTKAPLGMRNNNPTNIVWPNKATADRFGAIGASSNHDAGSTDGGGGHYRQMVFANPEDGMRAGARLALSKYRGGKTSTNELIASANGWTPGNYEAAKNIARTMGIGPGDDIKINTVPGMVSFLKALALQEHGNYAKQYKDSLYQRAATSILNS